MAGYKYIPNPQFQQQSAARQAQKQPSVPAASSAQPIQPPSIGAPYSPGQRTVTAPPVKKKRYDHAEELRNAARSVYHGDYKGDPTSQWRANAYQGGLPQRFTEPPKPGAPFEAYRPGAAQPVAPTSPGTPYNPPGDRTFMYGDMGFSERGMGKEAFERALAEYGGRPDPGGLQYPGPAQPNPRQTAIEDLFRRNNVNMPSGFMDQLLKLLGSQAPPPQLPPDFEGPLPGPRDPGLPTGPRPPETPMERAERFRREQQLNSRWEYYRNLPEAQQRAAQYDPAAQRELAELTEWRRTGQAPGGGSSAWNQIGGFSPTQPGFPTGGGFGFPSGGFGGGGMDPMQQMWQQSMNAWTMPKQQLLGWGQQMQQMPWGPNYGNTTDRPDPFSQQVSGPFGNDYGNLFGNMSGFIQSVNNQAMQKPVGVYQGTGNPGAGYGKVNYDIPSLLQQGQQMVQGGWQNPFMPGANFSLSSGPAWLGYPQ